MAEKELEELFRAKIGLEMAQFKNRMMKKGAESIYQEAYRISQMENIHALLSGEGKKMGKDVLKMMLMFPGLLYYLYSRWIKKEDSYQQELKECLQAAIRYLADTYKEAEKEEEGIRAA